MIAACMLLLLAPAAAFPKGYHYGRPRGTIAPQTGQGSQASVASPFNLWKPLAFKKPFLPKHFPKKPAATPVPHSTATDKVCIIPVTLLHPIIGHSSPKHQLTVLTGNNVISLGSKSGKHSSKKISQVFIVSGNKLLSIHDHVTAKPTLPPQVTTTVKPTLPPQVTTIKPTGNPSKSDLKHEFEEKIVDVLEELGEEKVALAGSLKEGEEQVKEFLSDIAEEKLHIASAIGGEIGEIITDIGAVLHDKDHDQQTHLVSSQDSTGSSAGEIEGQASGQDEAAAIALAVNEFEGGATSSLAA